MKVLFIDNFDSFTFNVVEEFEKRDCEVLVYRNNIPFKTIQEVIKKEKPKLIVISPGPSSPKDAGISCEVINAYAGKIPIFGVCLGHQCIVESFGGRVGRSQEIVHGKASRINHDGKGLFKGLRNNFKAGRYHSLEGISVPYCLEISARSESGVVMGVRHKDYTIQGVQFHPESILTPEGGLIIENIIKQAK